MTQRLDRIEAIVEANATAIRANAAAIANLREFQINGTFILSLDLPDYTREKLFVRRPASCRKNNAADRVYRK